MDDILKELEKLSVKDLVAIRDKASMLVAIKSIKDDPVTIELLWKELDKVFHSKFKASLMPFYTLKNKMPKLYKKLKEVHETLNTMAELIIPECNRIHKVKMYWLFAKLVTDTLGDDMNCSFTITTVLNYISVFPSLLNAAFPNYTKEMLAALIFNGEANEIK